MTSDELREAVSEALYRDNTLTGRSYDQGANVAIRVVLDAACRICGQVFEDSDDGDEATEIETRIRALMPNGCGDAP